MTRPPVPMPLEYDERSPLMSERAACVFLGTDGAVIPSYAYRDLLTPETRDRLEALNSR